MELKITDKLIAEKINMHTTARLEFICKLYAQS